MFENADNYKDIPDKINEMLQGIMEQVKRISEVIHK